jgi:peptide/nickel transport system substrate-binding protein
MPAVVLVVLAVLFAAGCGGDSGDASASESGDAGPPQRGGTLTFALSKEPSIINPLLAIGSTAVSVLLVDGLNDPMILFDAEGKWQPIIATRVPTEENGDVVKTPDGKMHITVRFRPEAAWSDGVPLRCEDLEFTWRTFVDPDNAMSNRLGWEDIETIECPEPTTAVIHMKRVYALYRSRILAVGPLPKHVLDGKDFNTYWNDRVTVSSGPFEFKEWQRGVRLELVRNERWWRAGPDRLPWLDRIVFRFVKDPNTLKMQLRMTESDVAWLPVDTNLISELEATPDVEYASESGSVVEFFIMQTDRPPLDDVNVRRAISYAIDRKMITDVVLKGQAESAGQALVPAGDRYVYDHFDVYQADEAKVNDHMTAAGYQKVDGIWQKEGKPVQLVFVSAAASYPYRLRTAQLVQQQLKALGFGMEIRFTPPEVLYSTVAPQGKFHLAEWSEVTGIEPAPELLFACDQIPKKPTWAGKNRWRWCDPKTDALMREASGEIDIDAREKIVGEVNANIAKEVPVLPLFLPPETLAWLTRVNGIVVNAEMGNGWAMEDWWVEQ